jgi:hypothetical protein
MDMNAAATAWTILTPATMSAAWLDVWLENSEPHPLSQARARADSRWAIPVLAGLAILLSGYLVGSNLKNASEKDAELQGTPLWDGSQSAQPIEKVQLPGMSGSNGPSTVTANFGHRIRLDGDVEGGYQFVVTTVTSERITLFLIQGVSDRHVVASSSGDEHHPAAITAKLEKEGKYFVCVMPEDQPSCSLSSVANLRDFNMLVINGDIWRKIDIHAPHMISISPSQ